MSRFSYIERPLVYPGDYVCARCHGGSRKLWHEPWGAPERVLCGPCILGDLAADWTSTQAKARGQLEGAQLGTFLHSKGRERIVGIDADGLFVTADGRRTERVHGTSPTCAELFWRIPAVPWHEPLERPYWGMPTEVRAFAPLPSANGLAWWRAAPSL